MREAELIKQLENRKKQLKTAEVSWDDSAWVVRCIVLEVIDLIIEDLKEGLPKDDD